MEQNSLNYSLQLACERPLIIPFCVGHPADIRTILLKKSKFFFQVDDLRLCIYRNHKKIILARLDGDSDGGDVGVPIGKSQNRVK